ncbi:PIG-L deacetylase family protein [Bryobacter aggregatus]|uniref:PIG-L deacetylase family protein n=1 Tax=Bryobacter aggregatus TaxID=360054 RepID=UPI0004E1A03B|nr:PIG-L family deacetylase [Bryobacter aggregatus]
MRQYIRQLYRLVYPKLYGRQDLKLIFNSSVGQLEERARLLLAATDFFQGVVRSIPIRAPLGESLLVVAPHQDDEAIGCGGALALQVRAGKQARIVLLQDGAGGHEDLGMTRSQMSALRNAESTACAAVLGLAPPRFLNHPDLSAASEQIVAQLVALIREQHADAILSPFPLDAHPEHRIAAVLLAEVLRQIPWPVRVLTYEVWGLCIANVALPIDEVLETKRQMLERFVFANQALDYTNSTIGLNSFRSRQLPPGECRYAECFFELPKADYISFMDRLRA